MRFQHTSSTCPSRGQLLRANWRILLAASPLLLLCGCGAGAIIGGPVDVAGSGPYSQSLAKILRASLDSTSENLSGAAGLAGGLDAVVHYVL